MSADSYQPLRRLWGAVILQAVRDTNSPDPDIRRRALIYIRIRLPRFESQVGSLRWICETFDLDFETTRAKLMTREGRAEMIRAAMPTAETGMPDQPIAEAA